MPLSNYNSTIQEIKNDFNTAFRAARSNSNLSQGEADSMLLDLCNSLATAIVTHIHEWLDSNKKTVNSIHPPNNSGYSAEQNSRSTDKCGITF